MMKQVDLNILAVVGLLLLGACASPAPVQTVYEGGAITAPVAPVVEEPVVERVDEAHARAMLLADMLYEARLAYEDNRLMTPTGNNAYDRYQQVLRLDRGNKVALAGIQDIVVRYIALADEAMVQAKVGDAEALLERAASLNPERPELAAAYQRLEAARHTRVDRFDIDPEALAAQDLELMVRLAEIAQHIESSDATFLINARNDAEGRWIYKVMREAVGGYRLRGNIDISSTPNILVTLPAG